MPSSSHPPIRSFVLRQGRVSNAQRRAVDTLLSVHGIAYAPGALDFEQVFGRRAPTILEIGFGMGETTAQIAQAHPENNYLGIEVHTPGVGSLLKLIAEGGLTNLRLIQHDAVEVLRAHDRRRVARRRAYLLSRPLAEKTPPQAPPDPAAHSSRCSPRASRRAPTFMPPPTGRSTPSRSSPCSAAEPALANTAPGFAPRPDYRPLTKFESRGLKLGHGVWDVIFRKT